MIWGQVGRLGASWGRLLACLRDGLDVLVTQTRVENSETRVGAIDPHPRRRFMRPFWEASWGHVGADVGLMLAPFSVMIF